MVVLLPSSPLLYYVQEEDAAVAVSFVPASEHERERERERESVFRPSTAQTPGHFARSINLLLTSCFSLLLAATLSQLVSS